MIKVAFYDTKQYDLPSFEKYGKERGISFKFFEAKLDLETAQLANECDGVCVFVNDDVNKEFRAAAYKVANGEMTVDEAIDQYGNLWE